MKKIFFYLLLIALPFRSFQSYSQVINVDKISSPDKLTSMEIGVDKGTRLKYRVIYNNKEIIGWSALGFVLNNRVAGQATRIVNKTQSSHTETFSWPLGENDQVQNNYRAVKLHCKSSSLVFNIEARVFNGSVAFRYQLPTQPGLEFASIKQEKTEFNFQDNYAMYQYHQESVFTPVRIDTFNTSSDFPSTLTGDHFFCSVGEADNQNYTKAQLKRGTLPHSLAITFARDSTVKISLPFQTPWRTISISNTAIGLHNCSELNLKLALPGSKVVPTWIKPGKLIRAQLNTQSGLDCIDFAAKHNFQYIMFDAGWYGAEFRSTSDPTQVIPQIDMQQIIRHGKEKGIGVILYVNYVGLRAKLDTILPLFKKWGVSGMKFGFVDGLTQEGITWLAAAIKKVNEFGFILDIHDNYKPTGLSRTYPALLTQEGIRGDENSPDAFHTTLLPFTRFLAGPADFTFCYPNATNSYSKNLLVSKAQQLALTVIYFSPLQSIFWYGQPNDYTNEQEIEFFRLVPTVWNESRYLAGEPGKNISVARRKGADWYIGNAAGLKNWQGTLSFDFLDKGKVYTATVYEDDGNGSIRKRSLAVKKGDRFPVDIKATGGQALVIYQDTTSGRSAGLPMPWKQQDIGAIAIAGHTDYDGKQFTIEAAGNATDSTKDELQFAYFPLETEGEITARLVHQPGSQFSKMGLMMRETLAANSAQASLILNLRKSSQVEAPRWQSLLVSRGASGKPLKVKNMSPIITEPEITNGNFSREYWLRLQRKFNSFTAFTSADGKTWTSLGSTFVEMKKKFFAGIAVSSGLRNEKTRIVFDNISIPGWRSGE